MPRFTTTTLKQLLFFAVTLSFTVTASAETLRIATLNCEFLYPSKVHIKYGLKFALNDTQEDIWDAGTFRQDKFEVEQCKADG